MSEEFHARVQIATGMSYEDALALGAEQERLRAERIRAAGYCCEAGAVASPHPCPWHPDATRPAHRAGTTDSDDEGTGR